MRTLCKIFKSSRNFGSTIWFPGLLDNGNLISTLGCLFQTSDMFYAYVIRSVKFSVLYKGHCENMDERLRQHNAGMTKSIRPYTPFELVYKEEFQSRVEAITREKYFKTPRGRKFLKTKIDKQAL